MSKNSVILKANSHAISMILDSKIPFDELKECITEKFKAGSKSLYTGNIALSFEGRELSSSEEKEILDIISEYTTLNVVCVVDKDQAKEEYYKKIVENKLAELSTQTGQFYKGTLRSGQVLEVESSVIILGDVNPGARVVAKGNVIILGAVKGIIYAGAGGNQDAFVVALDMNPMQVRIGDVIARSDDEKGNKSNKYVVDPKIAFVEDGNIYIEKLDKNILSDIRI